MTDDGKQKTEKDRSFFAAVQRRHHPANRMRFLFTMSISENGAQNTENGYLIRPGLHQPLLSKIKASRRALQPSREPRDLQTDLFHRNV
jgi:hypothetical protein